MPAAIPTPANARRGVQNGRFAQIPHLTGVIIGGYAALCLLWSVSPLLRLLTHRPREYIDQYYFDAPDTSIVWALFLALLAGALTARKRIAWWILTGYLLAFAAINAATIVVGGPASHAWHLGTAVAVQSAVIAVLIAARGEFYTRVRPGAGWKAAAVFIACLGASTLLGWGLVELSPGTLPAPQRFWWALNRVTAVFIDNDEFSGRPHIFVSMLLGLLGAFALLAAVTTLFRSQHAANALTGADESALRGLLTGAGADDSLGYFATRRDKEVAFAPNGKAAITFRVELGVCLASGDPIGVTSAWPQAISAWLAQAQRFGWVPAVMGTSERGATAYQRAGLSVLQLGDEAVIYPASFTLSGPAMKPVRQASNRLRKQGFSVLIRRHRYIGAEEMAEVSRRADTWRDTSTERGFSMALGRLGDPLDGECLLVEAIHQGRVVGMLSFVPWGSSGLSLDVMRRDPAGPNGVVELMVSAFAARAEEYGVTRISLNFAVFRSVFAGGERIGAGPVLRMTRRVLLFFSRWWQLEALYRSNMKYQPQWVPRFLCYDDSRKLARVGLAAALAEGFLPRMGGKKFAHKRTHGATPSVAGAPPSTDHAPESDAARPPRRRRPEQVRVRMRKLARLRANGTDAYPPADPPTHTIAAASFAGQGAVVRIAGRVVRLRDFGGVIFVVLRDETDQVQVLIDRATVGAAACAAFSASFDLGDLAEFSGVIGRSRNGEMSVLARRWRMNGKSFHPLPDKWKGLANPEALVRQRYLDLAVNQDAQQLLRDRSTITRSLRDSLHEAGFLEVETPILQRVHGGANAAPFRTHINAYDLDLYLRIAPELYLKRLCVGGVSKVFELGRAFRNEGADYSHNPEFTILEAYEAHSDYDGMRRRCQQLVQQAAIAVHGQPVVMRRSAAGVLEPVDISGDWPVIAFYDAVSDAVGEQVSADTPLPDLVRLAEQAGISYHSGWDAGQIALELYERLVESRTAKPTFYQDFPLSVSPLTRSHRTAPGVAERWDLVAWGTELGTAYSELTDPVEQRRRLTEQSMLAAGGDPDAMELDEDFLHALEHAMPPTGGLGLGVDRVVMLITGRSIRETLPFPLVK